MGGLIKDGRGRPVTRVDRTQVVLSISRSDKALLKGMAASMGVTMSELIHRLVNEGQTNAAAPDGMKSNPAEMTEGV